MNTDRINRAVTRKDVDIEREVLGILIRFPGRMHDSGVTGRHFYEEMHSSLFRTLQDRGCSLSTLHGATGIAPDIIMDISERGWSDASLKQHLAYLSALAEIRDSAKAAREMLEKIADIEPIEARPMIDQATAEMAKAVGHARGSTVDAINADEVLASSTGEKMPTCFDGIVLRRSELFFLAAEPKTGKTTFATQVLRHFVAAYDGLNLMLSMEMTAKEIFEKDIQRFAGHRVDQFFADGTANPEFVSRAQQVRDWYRNDKPGKLLIDHRGMATVREIKSKALQVQAEHGRRLRVIVIDQFDKLVPERIKENDSSNLKSVSIDLNNLAKELDVAVVCLIQLNGRKRKPDERLTKDDVFGTSGPLQDAGQLWLMQKPPGAEWDKKSKTLPLELSLAAGREGISGIIYGEHHGPSATILQHNKAGF